MVRLYTIFENTIFKYSKRLFIILTILITIGIILPIFVLIFWILFAINGNNNDNNSYNTFELLYNIGNGLLVFGMILYTILALIILGLFINGLMSVTTMRKHSMRNIQSNSVVSQRPRIASNASTASNVSIGSNGSNMDRSPREESQSQSSSFYRSNIINNNNEIDDKTKNKVDISQFSKHQLKLIHVMTKHSVIVIAGLSSTFTIFILCAIFLFTENEIIRLLINVFGFMEILINFICMMFQFNFTKKYYKKIFFKCHTYLEAKVQVIAQKRLSLH